MDENVVRLFPKAQIGDSGDGTAPVKVTPPNCQNQPQLSHGKDAYANNQATLFEFEQAIYALIKETGGKSKTIPRFRQILRDLRSNSEKLKP